MSHEQQFTPPWPFKRSKSGRFYALYDDLGDDIKSQLPRANNAEFALDIYHLNVWQTNDGNFLVFLETIEQYEAKKKQELIRSRKNDRKWTPKKRIVELIEIDNLQFLNSILAENNSTEFHSVLSVGDTPRYYLVRRENTDIPCPAQPQPNSDILKKLESVTFERDELREALAKTNQLVQVKDIAGGTDNQ